MPQRVAKKHHIAVIGAGYVGLVAGACFADLGIPTIVVDRSQSKVDALAKGKAPFYEPGLEALMRRAIKRTRLSFTIDLKSAIENSKIIMIAVGTPSMASGKVDMQDYWHVIGQIAKHLNGYKVIVNKSTVPVGTAAKAKELIRKKSGKPFDMVSFPEFLREGTAINDFLKPDRLIIGTDSLRAKKVMEEILGKIRTQKLFTCVETAEMIKYASRFCQVSRVAYAKNSAAGAAFFAC